MFLQQRLRAGDLLAGLKALGQPARPLAAIVAGEVLAAHGNMLWVSLRQAVELLTARRDSLHQAHHEAMECLGTMLWESQRAGRPPDGQAYIEAVRRRATTD